MSNVYSEETSVTQSIIKTGNQRIESLDWLRGLMAIAIMFYHFTSYSFFQPDASSFLGKFSIYAVSIFFIISGLSMAIVYNAFINSLKTAWFFFVRRIFRIWPLLWLCVFLGVLAGALQNIHTDPWKIFLNITTLFGFIKPDAYINTGAWSIGNEMVYYFLTPLIIFLFNRKIVFGNILLIFSVIIGIFFAFNIFNPNVTLEEQWIMYINPLNNLFFYIAGIAIFYNLKNRNFPTDKFIYTALSIISILIFIFYPIYGDRVNLIVGVNRIALSLASIILVISFYKFPLTVPRICSYPLKHLGIATYGVYLFHPIVFQSIRFIIPQLKTAPVFIFIISTVLTISVALLSFNFFEKPIMKIGKKMTKNSQTLNTPSPILSEKHY